MYESPDMTAAVKVRHNIEKRIVKRTVRDLIKAGYELNVDDGDGKVLNIPTTDETALLDALMNTDEDYLLVYKPGEPKHFSYVFFVYGNDGYDVISDYGVSLEEDLRGVNEFADSLA